MERTGADPFRTKDYDEKRLYRRRSDDSFESSLLRNLMSSGQGSNTCESDSLTTMTQALSKSVESQIFIVYNPRHSPTIHSVRESRSRSFESRTTSPEFDKSTHRSRMRHGPSREPIIDAPFTYSGNLGHLLSTQRSKHRQDNPPLLVLIGVDRESLIDVIGGHFATRSLLQPVRLLTDQHDVSRGDWAAR